MPMVAHKQQQYARHNAYVLRPTDWQLLVEDPEEILHLQLSILRKVGAVNRVLGFRPAKHCPQ